MFNGLDTQRDQGQQCAHGNPREGATNIGNGSRDVARFKSSIGDQSIRQTLPKCGMKNLCSGING